MRGKVFELLCTNARSGCNGFDQTIEFTALQLDQKQLVHVFLLIEQIVEQAVTVHTDLLRFWGGGCAVVLGQLAAAAHYERDTQSENKRSSLHGAHEVWRLK